MDSVWPPHRPSRGAVASDLTTTPPLADIESMVESLILLAGRCTTNDRTGHEKESDQRAFTAARRRLAHALEALHDRASLAGAPSRDSGALLETAGRTFPIQGPSPHRNIPWWLAEEAYASYSERYRGQSLEVLASRGGFSAGEMDMFAPGWRDRLDYVKQLERDAARMREERDDACRQRDEQIADKHRILREYEALAVSQREHIEALRIHGGSLSNCAYNLAQNQSLDQRTRASLHAARVDWDAAVKRYRQALHAAALAPSGEPTTPPANMQSNLDYGVRASGGTISRAPTTETPGNG
jgi:hypothetical protein